MESEPVTPVADCCFLSVPFVDELEQLRQVMCVIFWSRIQIHCLQNE